MEDSSKIGLTPNRGGLASASVYEDDFERELECDLAASSDDDNQNLANVGTNKQQRGSSSGSGAVFDSSKTPLLDHAGYGNCDADLENLLETALLECSLGENDEQQQRAKNAARALSSSSGNLAHDGDDNPVRNTLAKIFGKFGLQTQKATDSYFDAAEEVGYDSTPDSGVHESLMNMDPEQRAKLEEEWKTELAKVEDEIQTLRQVLTSKVKQSQDLKRKLGITVWKEFVDDMGQGLKNVKESTAFQKTETVIKTASEKTTELFGTLGTSVKKGLGDVKNSTAYKSFEEKVGYAYSNVKDKVSGSRSSSVQNFEEALAATEGTKSGSTTPGMADSIPEDKPL